MLFNNETKLFSDEVSVYKYPNWATTKEASQYLRLSPNALRIMVCRKKIKAYKIGRRLRFSIMDLKALIKKEG